MSESPSDAFLRQNDSQTKELAVAVEIDGLPGLLASTGLFEQLRYGMPNINYGMPGLIYGGLIPLESYNGGEIRTLLSLDGSSLTLSQKLEPEQGRGSVSTLSLAFVDYQGFMTQVISPGVLVDEILGRRVKVWLGYKRLSFPKDYYVIFRGRISGVQSLPGQVVLQLSDPNLGRRQQIFYTAKTTLTGALSPSDTTVAVASNTDFHQHILGPDGAYDPAVRLYLKIEDEYIEYGPTHWLPSGVFGTNLFSNCARGQRGSTAVAHDAGTDVQAFAVLEDRAIPMALKIMLSGWAGDWLSGVTIKNVVYTGDPFAGNVSGGYVLPAKKDARRDYGITEGDTITISGDPTPANNGTFIVTGFRDIQTDLNRVIVTDNAAAVASVSSPALLSFRSKYDTYPKSFGCKLGANEVDVLRHEEIQNTFLAADENSYRFTIGKAETAKAFLESEVYLPVAAYSLTRFGRLSVGLTKPPIADDRLQFLTEDNVLDPQNVRPVRALNNRRFFNEISWKYDETDQGDYLSTTRTIDATALGLVGLSSVLPIASRGARTDLGVFDFISRRNKFLLARYARAAVELNIKVNYGAGVQIEAGDVVALKDDGTLQIANFDTGERRLGVQLFEVIERTLDIRSGLVQLRLLGGVGFQASDRFATFGPSSVLGAGSTTTELVIQDSYGPKYPGDERRKWKDYVGLTLRVRSEDYAFDEEVALLGVSNSNPYLLQVDALSAAPPAGYLVDMPQYPTDLDPYTNQAWKVVHVSWGACLTVTGAGTPTTFLVSLADAARIKVGSACLVRAPEWQYQSNEVKITGVDTGTGWVTVSADLGLTPATGDRVELVGFADGGGQYRFV